MDKVLSRNGYSIILKNTGNSRQKEAKCLEELLKKDIDGLIIEPSKSQLICRHRSIYRNFEKYGIPYIFIQGIYMEMKEHPHILMDDARGGYLVTKYLLDTGHRRIAGFLRRMIFRGSNGIRAMYGPCRKQEYPITRMMWYGSIPKTANISRP